MAEFIIEFVFSFFFEGIPELVKTWKINRVSKVLLSAFGMLAFAIFFIWLINVVGLV